MERDPVCDLQQAASSTVSMDHEARTMHASQQGHRRTSEQDHTGRMEDPHQTRGDLSLADA